MFLHPNDFFVVNSLRTAEKQVFRARSLDQITILHQPDAANRGLQLNHDHAEVALLKQEANS